MTLLDLMAGVLTLGGLVVAFMGTVLLGFSSTKDQKTAAFIISLIGLGVSIASGLYLIFG